MTDSTSNSTTLISIIICTRDRADSLEATLASLAQVGVPSSLTAELLLVDNGSTDRTAALAEYPMPNMSVRYLHDARPGKARACNGALRAARGEILAFTDDDLRFPQNWLETLCAPILENRADLVQGGIRWSDELRARLAPGSEYLMEKITSTGHKTADDLRDELIGANMAFRRAVFESVGHFDEALGPGALGFGEDTLFGWQALRRGFRKVNVLEVEVEHHFSSDRLTRKALLEIARRKGESGAYIARYWQNREEPWALVRWMALACKDTLRTLLDPSGCPGRPQPPAWKFSYAAERAYLWWLLRQPRDRAKPTPSDSAHTVGPYYSLQ